jgi:hypothetical protein
MLATASSSDARSTKRFCSSKGSVTVIRTERVRIFRKDRALFGCDKRGRRKMRLGSSGFGVEEPTGKTVSKLKVAHFFVAYTLSGIPTSSQGPFGSTDVRWVDLRRGLRISPQTGCDRRRQISDGNVVRSLVLSGTGAMAWVCSDVLASEVHKLDKLGATLLDTSLSPGDMHLALSESPDDIIYWTNEGTPRSTNLFGF